MRPFENWTYEEVEDTFGLTEVSQMNSLDEWLDANSIALTEMDLQQAEYLRLPLSKKVDGWNEDELKMFFIGPMLVLANLESLYFNRFTQRPLSAYKGGVVVASGKVDFMLAKGKVIPKQPYFCLHEYKPQKHRDTDPRGQVLIAMVAAQEKNDPELPVYGVYVVGRLWFFTVLEGKQHTVSPSFSASGEEVLDILRILRKGKLLIEAHAAAMVPAYA